MCRFLHTAMHYPQSKSALLIVSVLPVFFAITHGSLGCSDSAGNSNAGRPWVLPYSSTDDPRLHQNLARAEKLLTLMNSSGSDIRHFVDRAADITLGEAIDEGLIVHLVSMNKNYWEGFTLLFDASVYASELLSADGTDKDAQAFRGQVGNFLISFIQAHLPAAIILKFCKDEVFEEFLKSDKSAKEAEFYLSQTREMKLHALSFGEENVITTLSAPGFSAWNTLWSEMSTAVSVNVALNGVDTPMGLSTIASYQDNPVPECRKETWTAEREGWLSLEIALTAALNSITKWRSTNDKLRNHPSSLTETLSLARMSKPSHDAMFKMLDNHAANNRRVLRVHGEAWQKSLLDPWDIWASSPLETEEHRIPYEDAIDLIAKAVGAYVPKAGEFVKRMRDNERIEAAIRDTKKFGSHCAFFPVDKVPVVYMDSYNGGLLKLNTLAHELGHAYHTEIMKDLPLSQMFFGLNLAETASLFFEAIMDEYMLAEASEKDLEDLVSAHYRTTRRVADYLLQRPIRFEFEAQMHNRTKDRKLSKLMVDELMVKAWKKYFGDSVNRLEDMGYFAYKTLHYYKTDTPFYNWQYTFGYLMAEKLFLECKANKENCQQIHNDFFMDSGIMKTEDLVQKHLYYDITEDKIWDDVAREVESKICQFESAWSKYKETKDSSVNDSEKTCGLDGAQCN